MQACASCGRENPAEARFCMACAAPLPEATPAHEVRKVVTVVFCDLVGSTALGEQVDPEALRARMGRTFEELRRIVERHGGTVEKFVGDAVMAVFGIPQVHEDDALRAVRAAAELRTAVIGHGFDARVGVNTGRVVAGGSGETLVTGDAVNVAARLEQAAPAGEILLGAETRRLVRDAIAVEALAPLALKGKAQPVAAFRLLELDPDAPAVARHLETPLVGRQRELRLLGEAFDRASSERACHLFTLLGAAGVGKSRLAQEFLTGLDATVLRGRCLDYGEGITFFPVVEALRQLGAEAEPTLARIEQGGTSPQELFWAVRKLLERTAVTGPLVAVFDDVQWGEPTFLDLIDHVADLSRGAPILLLCLARPELLDDRPGWAGGKLNATTMLLEPLEPRESEALIVELGGADLDEAVRARIVEAAEGNPLFVEEMLVLVREDGDVRVPPTIQALLSARLERLGSEERGVVERGAVEGSVFHAAAVRELSPERVWPRVETHLLGLVRKELIRPEEAQLPGEDAYRFRHLLIRDAAYDSLPKETRAELHERFAGWLEAHGAGLLELDEIVGYHLEQAVRYRRELGATEAETADLAARAAARLDPAGQRAKARGDLAAARNLLERAAGLAPGVRRLELLADEGEILKDQGLYSEASVVLAPLTTGDDPRIAHHARVLDCHARLYSDPDAAMGEAEATARAAIDFFTTAGDELGLARAWSLLFYFHWTLSQLGEAGAAQRRVREHAERAGSVYLSRWARGIGPALRGPASREETRALLDELAPEARESPVLEANIYWARGILAGREGRLAEAHSFFDRCVAVNRDLGNALGLAGEGESRAEVELLAGDVGKAERFLREAVTAYERLGEKAYQSTMVGSLANVLCAQGRFAEAEEAASRALELGAKDDRVTVGLSLGALAQVRLSRGDMAGALAAAREAVELVSQGDSVLDQAAALLRLASVERGAGLDEDARASAQRALELYDRKGVPVMAERVRALLAEL